MKKIALNIIIIIATIVSQNCFAQIFTTDYKIVEKMIKVDDNNLNIYFKIAVNNPHTTSNKSITLTPYIKLKSGEVTTLPPIAINGRNKQIAYQRNLKRNTKNREFNQPIILIEANKKSNLIVDYSYSLPFNAKMYNSELMLKECVSICSNNFTTPYAIVIDKNIAIPRYFASYIKPQISQQQISQDTLYFEENYSNILLWYQNNRQTLNKIKDIASSQTIETVKIVGSASPKGDSENNEVLSRKRARIVANYLVDNYNINANNIKTDWIGENWQDFSKLVEQSTIQSKFDISDIIRNSTSYDSRENQLMKLNNGSTYRYISNYIYPKLRSAYITIYLKSRAIDITKLRDRFYNNPQSLTANEILTVASSFPRNSTRYIIATRKAIELYPQNVTAVVNYSSILINEKDYRGAIKLLKQHITNPKTWNNIGVIYLITGDYSNAQKYLSHSLQQGSITAIKNIKELNKIIQK